jgi:hypothetical protein
VTAMDEQTTPTIVRMRVEHPRSVSVMRALGAWAGVDTDIVDTAIAKVRNGDVAALLVSGAQASGKDTVCPAVMARSGITGATQCRVAHAIRAEMCQIVASIEAASGIEDCVRGLQGHFDVTYDAAMAYVDAFYAETRNPNHGIDVHERSERMRRCLQLHGGEGKAHRPNYWVKKAYQTIIPTLASGHSVYLTDGRFPGEVDAGRSFGAMCVRLWVPEEQRIERIRARDGFVPSLETLRHPGETALDGYWGLDAEVDNTGDFDHTVATITEMFDEHRLAMRELN